MSDIDNSLLISRSQACKALNIKPRTLADEASLIWHRASDLYRRHVGEPGPEDLKLRGIEVDPDAILRFINDYLRPSDVRLLIELRAKGALPVTKRRLDPVPDWLVTFAAQDETELEARSAALKAEREHAEEKERARYRQMLENLAAVEEKDFTWKLLDDIFWHHKGKGAGTLTIGGLAVTKSLIPYASNSGRSRDFNVSFRWIGADGKPHGLVKPSAYEANRRYDPERNWGLPE